MTTPYTFRAFLLTGLLLTCTLLRAQELAAPDTILFRTGERIAVHIDELGLDEITYRPIGEDVRISVEKDAISRIRMHNGRIVNVTGDLMSVGFSQHTMAKKNVVKVEVLSLAFDHLTMGYERILKPWMNIEARASYIGVGNGRMKDQSTGVMVAGGIKFIARPDHIMRGMRLGHPLQGRYVKPEILVNSFTVNSHWNESYDWYSGQSTAYQQQLRVHYTNVALNIVLGKQRLLGDGLTLDTWIGIGYAFQAVRADDPSQANEKTFCYNHMLLGRDLPIALSAGMSLGIAF